MADFNSVLDDARQLSPEDRVKLIDALWESVPADLDVPLHPDWAPELERRVAAIEAGTAGTIPWTTIREEALARIGHGNVR
jgi:putative addiction module component (TIGR02574 family)